MSKLQIPFGQDPELERFERIARDPAYGDDPLIAPMRELVERYGRLLRNFMKTIRISDHYQLRLKELNAALDEAVRTDYLTGLMNRRAFFDRMEAEHSRSRRHDRPLCVLMADIDHFKEVNDLVGHDAGDAALIEVARIFSGALRREDLKVRWGGEEFLALLPETDLEGGSATAEKLRARVEASEIAARGNVVRVTMSVGVAADQGDSLDRAIGAADQALLEAKRRGRNRVEVAPAGG